MNLPASLLLVFLICTDYGLGENELWERRPEVKKAGHFGRLFDEEYQPFMDKIIGGSLASHGDIPWQASVKIDGDHHCGAAILDEYWLLSAAHCYHLTPVEGLTITVGEHHLDRPDPGQQDFKVEAFFNHDLYNGDTHDYDFALIKIRPANGGRGIQNDTVAHPISLPPSNIDLPEGTRLLISGWGHTAQGSDEISDVLKKASVPYVSQERCVALHSGYTITDRMFCAGFMEGGTDTCQQDSGGPVSYNSGNEHVLFGIVSWGDGCAQPHKPGVYARVTTVLPWIKNTINSHR